MELEKLQLNTQLKIGSNKNLVLKIILPYAIIIALFVGGCFLVKSIFSGSGSSDKYKDEVVKLNLAIRDTTIKYERERSAHSQEDINRLQNELSFLHKKDSLTEIHSKQIELAYNKFNETIKNIPARISKLSGNADSILAAFRDF